MCVYLQHSGELFRSNELRREGYSGHGILGINNPSMEDIPYIGPIPRGLYSIRERKPFEVPGSSLKELVLRLDPIGHDAKKRSPLLVHGDSTKGNASRGCIIHLKTNARLSSTAVTGYFG
jgi:hypothetical protein